MIYVYTCNIFTVTYNFFIIIKQHTYIYKLPFVIIVIYNYILKICKFKNKKQLLHLYKYRHCVFFK
jgi:hypothetical protein